MLDITESAHGKPDVSDYGKDGSRSHEFVDVEYAARHEVAEEVDSTVLDVLQQRAEGACGGAG
ncbi:hypothetical protein [Streptomyces sp. NPDC102282]|uniref:hypothetical protein n=1 Tax=Streptomyces sp. NPDC102282 TaxID=3366154 RepID=UPI00381D9BDB